MGTESMQQPLLHRTPDEEFGRRLSSGEVEAAVAGGTAAAEEEEKDCPPVRGLRDAWKVFATESKKLWAIGAPIALNTICLYLYNSVTQVFAGHLGNLELSSVSIALNVISTFTFGFLLGMASALETLCGQAFGAGQLEMLGVYMQRSWIILMASALLMCPLYFVAAPVLRLIGQEHEIADLAGKFAISIIPQMFALAITFPAQKFFQAQSKVLVLAWIGFGALLLHIGMLALFTYVFHWGTPGLAAAYDLSAWVVSLAQVAYVMGWCRDAWTGFTWAAFKDIWAFVRLSLASAVMLCLEIWYLTILNVLTGDLKNAEVAIGSIAICMNINGWESMLFIGINAAVSVRVSNELGAGRPRATRHAVIVVLIQSLMIGLFCMTIIFATRNYFSIIFTSDKDMQRAVAKLAYLLSITMVLNSIQPVISGVAVGGGWQAVVAYINLGCYYILGVPLGFIMGFLLNLGVEGIWSGMLCGTLVQTLILLFIVWRTDWKAEVCHAEERVQLWGGQDEAAKART